MESASNERSEIFCGVAEGFYGRPWTTEQRRDLFRKMHKLGLHTYLYAPKDDLKHRAEWKELYTPAETDLLKDLIKVAKAHDVTFVYALSPGVDIIYSKEEDLDAVKSKFMQVRSLGCVAFALLFDDIDMTLHESDAAVFPSIVHAQVGVANAVYQYLGSPIFFFCPTEYCETRSTPSLEGSEYLAVLGKSLLPEIHIFWTGCLSIWNLLAKSDEGPRIVSRFITVDHLQAVSKILNRKPLIWDNLHANDYDPRRIFLGPYTGRSTKIKKEVSGVLLNPNCRYEANFVPLCTMSEWLNSADDIDEEDLIDTDVDSPSNGVYKSSRALQNAVKQWLEYASHNPENAQQSDDQAGKKIESDVPLSRFVIRVVFEAFRASLNLMEVEKISTIVQKSLDEIAPCRPCGSADKMDAYSDADNLTSGVPPLNSLSADYSEPMNLVVERIALSNSSKENDGEESNDVKFEEIGDEMISTDVCMAENSDSSDKNSCETTCLDFDHLATFVDFYYLPFEHGSRVIQMFEEFCWLRENSLIAQEEQCSSTEDMPSTLWKEWEERLGNLLFLLRKITNLYQLFFELPNKGFVQELVPYVHEAQGVTTVLEAILLWMADGNLRKPQILTEKDRFWLENTQDGEPWTVSAGSLVDLFRVLYITPAVADLLLVRPSIQVSLNCSLIKPLKKQNKGAFKLHPNFREVFKISSDNYYEDNMDECFERFISSYFSCEQPSTCFVTLEKYDLDKNRITSMVFALLNAKECAETIEADPIACNSWNFQRLPDAFYEDYPSQMCVPCNCTSRTALSLRKLICSTAVALSMNGSTGFFIVVQVCDEEKIEFLTKIGLTTIVCLYILSTRN